jgi:hypothetical protein
LNEVEQECSLPGLWGSRPLRRAWEEYEWLEVDSTHVNSYDEIQYSRGSWASKPVKRTEKQKIGQHKIKHLPGLQNETRTSSHRACRRICLWIEGCAFQDEIQKSVAKKYELYCATHRRGWTVSRRRRAWRRNVQNRIELGLVHDVFSTDIASRDWLYACEGRVTKEANGNSKKTEQYRVAGEIRSFNSLATLGYTLD